MTATFSADCPYCAAPGQRVGWWNSVSRWATTRCRQCDELLISTLTFSEYMGLRWLSTVLLFGGGTLFVVSMLADWWAAAAGAFLLMMGPPVALGKAFHARHLKDTPIESEFE
jgi:hypothetical protein